MSLTGRDSAAATRQAKVLFARGIKLGEQERWAEAAKVFRQARALQERPSIVYNLALSQYHLGQLKAAQSTLATLESLTKPGSRHRREGDRLRPLVEQGLAHLELHLAPETASVVLDGHLLPGHGLQRSLSLDPGRHLLAIGATGYLSQQLQMRLQPGETRIARVVLSSQDESISMESQGESAPELMEASLGTWIVVGLGIAACAAVGALIIVN